MTDTKKRKYISLKKSFFTRDTITVARELLGKKIIKFEGDKTLSGYITETEAYTGMNDPASHSYGGITKRNSVMFEDGGILYVYFIYGNYFCLNVVTEKKGSGSAVLIRAVEPDEGIEIMKMRRPNAKNLPELTNGPGKLCLAFGITKKHNGISLKKKEIIIAKGIKKISIMKSTRIGISRDDKYLYRFFIKDNNFVSKHKYNKIAKPIKKG